MKLKGNWLILGVVGIILLGSCFDPPTYSPIPSITFNDMYFNTDGVTDTLSVSVKFKDGDGDVGLAQGDTLTPFNQRFYYRFSNGKYLSYKDKRTTPGYDTLPAYVKPYWCTNWQTIISKGKVTDTLYYQSNVSYNNIFVDFYFYDASVNDYVKYDFVNEFSTSPNACASNYNGRLPVLSKDLSRKGALEGTIRYNIKSAALKLIFGSRQFKLKIRILDRALNKSNIVETDANNLTNITKK